MGNWLVTDTCIKRWGLRASSLSAVAKVEAGQKHSSNHLTPNVLYMMLPPGVLYFQSFFLSICYIVSVFCAFGEASSFAGFGRVSAYATCKCA